MASDSNLPVAESEKPKPGKVFSDPIHGHIELHPLCLKIIDTPQFQRLRYIKQLGGGYYVFPGASHNRFEHSLGVGYLAGELVKQLRQKQENLGITDEDVLCVEIAGLCHDLGHGPFSHLFDRLFIPKARDGSDWKHEDASVEMFDYLVTENNLTKEFAKYGLGDKDLVFIKELINVPSKPSENNEWQYKGRKKEKEFLYEVVANKRNGIDVDKWDYFARDCHHLGIKNSFDHNRFMKFARVLSSNGTLHIGTRDKEGETCYGMFYTRSALHRRAYQHKNTKIIETMISDAMLLADKHILTTNKDGKSLAISETIDDMSAYVKLNDGIFHQILYSTDENLKEAKAILERVERRELYRFIGVTKPVQPEALKFTEDEMSKKIAAISQQDPFSRPLDHVDIVVRIVKYDYGMKKDNPIDHVLFYSKSDPDRAMRVRKEQVSHMLPAKFSERLIQVYYKKLNKEGISSAEYCFKKFCEANNMHPPKESGDPESVEMTPNEKGGEKRGQSETGGSICKRAKNGSEASINQAQQTGTARSLFNDLTTSDVERRSHDLDVS